MTDTELRDLEQALKQVITGEVRFDRLTRRIYSTDASIYSIKPLGVVSPRSADDVVATVDVAKRFDVPILPRGAGTSLAGQTVGKAIVLDFSRYMHGLVAIDVEARTARVQPGLVQDDLNGAAKVITAALFHDNFRIHLSRRDVRVFGQILVNEAFIVTEVKVRLGSVFGDKDFAVLVRRHGSRIYI